MFSKFDNVKKTPSHIRFVVESLEKNIPIYMFSERVKLVKLKLYDFQPYRNKKYVILRIT